MKKNSTHTINNLINCTSTLNAVETPPLFKEKILNKLTTITLEKKKLTLIDWFVPKYQIAALLVFAFINLSALYLYEHSTWNENLEIFAETYGFSISDKESIFN